MEGTVGSAVQTETSAQCRESPSNTSMVVSAPLAAQVLNRKSCTRGGLLSVVFCLFTH